MGCAVAVVSERVSAMGPDGPAAQPAPARVRVRVAVRTRSGPRASRPRVRPQWTPRRPPRRTRAPLAWRRRCESVIRDRDGATGEWPRPGDPGHPRRAWTAGARFRRHARRSPPRGYLPDTAAGPSTPRTARRPG